MLQVKNHSSALFTPFLLVILHAGAWPLAGAENAAWQFSFGEGPARSGYLRVCPTNLYSREVGYGFEPGAKIEQPANGTYCTGDEPFYFSVKVPEGNYRVTVVFGGSTNTVKAELRRLMLEDVRALPGEAASRTFIVNVRTPAFAGDGEVHLKERERTSETWAWDEKMTLEFNGAHPEVQTLKIERADDVPTVYLLGDSTVCDQPKEPWNSWGQMLPRFFQPDVAVANNAESGETLKSSLGAKRLDKVLSTMKPGDYLLIQFGHNDMKDRAPDALATYKSNLERFVAGARAKGGTPILVTSMERKNGFEKGTLLQYPDTVREVAREENVPLIDLNAMSKVLYTAFGTNIDKAFVDGTHHNNYGSYELAKCVIQGIQSSGLPLAKHIVKDFQVFDPAHPDPVERFVMPASPSVTGVKPPGD